VTGGCHIPGAWAVTRVEGTIVDTSWLAGRFEENRRHLRSVAYRMLGSHSEADDAVQEAWLRLSRSDAGSIENLAGWLTTVVARVCLDVLRARRVRAEEAGTQAPGPILWIDEGAEGVELGEPVDPEREAILADSISLALLVVLETLAPSERLAFVLHDLFDVPFDEIAEVVGKTPAAARQMASRARRRLRVLSSPPDADLVAQQEVAAAFLAAARGGDFEALLRLLDPDVVVRGALGAADAHYRGAESAAKNAITGAQLTAVARLARVNGAPGFVSFDAAGQLRAVVTLAIRGGRIAEIGVLADPERLRRLDLGSPRD
jgi:RNA polymerase sigma factor (sigma-70 family)